MLTRQSIRQHIRRPSTTAVSWIACIKRTRNASGSGNAFKKNRSVPKIDTGARNQRRHQSGNNSARILRTFSIQHGMTTEAGEEMRRRYRNRKFRRRNRSFPAATRRTKKHQAFVTFGIYHRRSLKSGRKILGQTTWEPSIRERCGVRQKGPNRRCRFFRCLRKNQPATSGATPSTLVIVGLRNLADLVDDLRMFDIFRTPSMLANVGLREVLHRIGPTPQRNGDAQSHRTKRLLATVSLGRRKRTLARKLRRSTWTNGGGHLLGKKRCHASSHHLVGKNRQRREEELTRLHPEICGTRNRLASGANRCSVDRFGKVRPSLSGQRRTLFPIFCQIR